MALFYRISLPFFGIFFLISNAFAQTTFTKDQKILLKEALHVAVTDDNFLQEYPELKSKTDNVIYHYDKMVSLEEPDKAPVFLTEKMLPKFKNVKFELKTQEEIFDPERRQDMIFLRISQIPQPEGDYAIVTVLSQIALGSESREKGFLHKQTTGRTMLFKRTKKGWHFEKVVNIMPNLVDYKLPY